MQRSPLRELIETRLDEPLEALVARLRGEGMAWRPVAAEVSDRAGVNIAHETLRSWFRVGGDAP